MKYNQYDIKINSRILIIITIFVCSIMPMIIYFILVIIGSFIIYPITIDISSRINSHEILVSSKEEINEGKHYMKIISDNSSTFKKCTVTKLINNSFGNSYHITFNEYKFNEMDSLIIYQYVIRDTNIFKKIFNIKM